MKSAAFAIEEFASRRRKAQADIEAALARPVRRALSVTKDTGGWSEVLEVVAEQYERAYAAEVGERPERVSKEFLARVEKALQKAHRSASPTDEDVERTAMWLATAILSEATIAAARADEADLFLEWVTMGDSNVRHSHRDAAGQTRPIGEPFKVGKASLAYPGDTTGPIEEWINCRCTLRPVLADEALVAAAVEGPGVPAMPSGDSRSEVSECTCCGGSGEHLCGHECYVCDSAGTREAQQEASSGLQSGEPIVCEGHHGRPDPCVDDPAGDGCQHEPDPVAPDEAPKGTPVMAAGETYRDVSTEERKRDADAGRALPDGSFPIDNCSDLRNAIQAIGRAKDPAKAKAHIRKRKSALGCPDVELPDTWSEFEERLMAAMTEPIEDDRSHLCCIVALPTSDDGVNKIGEEQKHVTLAFLGEFEGDIETVKDAVAGVAGSIDGMVALVAGTAVLGPDHAKVWLVEDPAIEEVRKRLLDNDTIKAGVEAGDAHPHFIPHMTITYDGNLPAEATDVAEIAFDRLAVWHGDEQFEYAMGGDMGTKEDERTQVGTAPNYQRVPDDDAPPVPEEPFSEETAVPWFGPLAPEGIASGDGRKFAEGSLTNRPLPMPLTWQKTSDDGHRGNVTVAMIERVEKIDGVMWGAGHFIENPEAAEVIGLLAEFGRFGVSIDADQSTFEVDEEEETVVFTSARVCSACIVSIPAFAEAWVALGEWPFPEKEEDADEKCIKYDDDGNCIERGPSDREREDDIAAGLLKMSTSVDQFVDVAPGKTEDGPGWLTHPVDTDRLRDYWVRGPGAAKIGWGAPGDFNRCRAQVAKYVKPQHINGYCANRHYDALGVWPGPGKRGHAGETTDFAADNLGLKFTEPAQAVSLVASVAPLKAPAEWFSDPEFEEPTPLTITDEGRVFGHIATWDSCHINFPNECVNPPRSLTGYAHFLTGATHLDNGEVIPTGPITVGGGHAPDGLPMRAALAHYDDCSTAVCSVNCGEDAIGIWVAGWVRPGSTPEMVTALQASPPSGDWRMAGGNLELILAHSVNSPGYLVPRVRVAASGSEVISLVAAGALAPRQPEPEGIDMQALAREVAKQVIEIQETKQKMSALRDEMGVE